MSTEKKIKLEELWGLVKDLEMPNCFSTPVKFWEALQKGGLYEPWAKEVDILYWPPDPENPCWTISLGWQLPNNQGGVYVKINQPTPHCGFIKPYIRNIQKPLPNGLLSEINLLHGGYVYNIGECLCIVKKILEFYA